MSGTGSAMSGANTIVSSSTTSSPAPRRRRAAARACRWSAPRSKPLPSPLAGEESEASTAFVQRNGPIAGMPQQAPLYIVASPRPRVGKTLIARLLTEFFRSNGRALAGYDLDPREPTIAGYFPDLVATMNIADTPGQMALFDRLIAGGPRTTVIDLGYGLFEQFFDVMTEIGFVQEARRRSI